MISSPPYHRGELAVQARASLEEPAQHAGRAIRAAMPPVAIGFLAEQPALFVGAADRAGRIWSTMITGEPGFLTAPREDLLIVGARPAAPDPLAETLARPARVGMIAIEPSTRRRMRLNGHSRPHGDGLAVQLDQVVSNCPKYLQKRDVAYAAGDGARLAARGGALTERQQQWIGAADTFFVSTAADDGAADTSHRGGLPGFVQVASATRLSWPDYVGNAMFLTLGNLDVHPAAGLLFPDWSTGDLLHLTGTAVVDHTPQRAARVPGAQRMVDFTVTGVVEVAAGSPLRWSAPEFSRFNPPLR
jgi:predicted pyridoxine 5'-phosphate oxidase superfamily flavin-nucleotide-binding protein